MNNMLLSCAAFLILFVTVESLTCKSCDVTVLGHCFHTKHVNCSNNQDRCYDAVAEFSADILPIHARGCIENSNCRNETKRPILTVTYNITMTCCSTDLCNSATPIQPPLTAALTAALLALWSQWGP